MGNTVTKESDASAHSRASASRIKTSGRDLDSKSRYTNTGSHHSGNHSRSYSNGNRSTHYTDAHSNGSSAHAGAPSHHSHHSHHHSRHRHSRKRNAKDYEMIIDPNETVDGGLLFPQGVYHGPQDFKVSAVREAIVRRKLAPFYKGLDSVEPEWSDEELLEHVKTLEPSNPPKPGQPGPATPTQLIWLYRNTHECPICFLVYPRLNNTRCCGQGICTECFVQIKRNPPHPPYNDNNEAADVLDLYSEPSDCPYCAQSDLGVTFDAPPFEWGLPCPDPSELATSVLTRTHTTLSGTRPGGKEYGGPFLTKEEQSKPSSTSPPMDFSKGVTVDMIRPDWEEKLASARRRLARKDRAARMLHLSALIPNEEDAPHFTVSSSPHNNSIHEFAYSA